MVLWFYGTFYYLFYELTYFEVDMAFYCCKGLWLRLLRLGATEDPLSSFEYGTILGIEKKIIVLKLRLLRIFIL